jgi:hypothetical protein
MTMKDFLLPALAVVGIADTIITIGALTTFRLTGITDIISTAAGSAGIVTNIGLRITRLFALNLGIWSEMG